MFVIVIVWLYVATRMNVVMWSTVMVCLIALLSHVLLLSHWALGGVGPSTTIIASQRRSSWLIRNGIPRFIVAGVVVSYVLVLVERLCSRGVESVVEESYDDETVGVEADVDGGTTTPRISSTKRGASSAARVHSVMGEFQFLFHRSLWVVPSITLSMLLLGPGSPIAMLGILIASMCIVFVQKRHSWRVHQHERAGSTMTSSSVLWLNDEDVVVWWFMSTLSYFTTGHASTFGSIHISAAFIGIDEFHFGLSGLMLALNTWAGPIIHAIAVGTIFGKCVVVLSVFSFCVLFLLLCSTHLLFVCFFFLFFFWLHL